MFSIAPDNAEFNRAFIRKSNRTPFFSDYSPALSDATGVGILCAKGPEKRDGYDKGEERPK